MKVKQIPRIDIHDRIELKNALPLRTSYVIYIAPKLEFESKNAVPVERYPGEALSYTQARNEFSAAAHRKTEI